jgi:hypothetical protein
MLALPMQISVGMVCHGRSTLCFRVVVRLGHQDISFVSSQGMSGSNVSKQAMSEDEELGWHKSASSARVLAREAAPVEAKSADA